MTSPLDPGKLPSEPEGRAYHGRRARTDQDTLKVADESAGYAPLKRPPGVLPDWHAFSEEQRDVRVRRIRAKDPSAIADKRTQGFRLSTALGQIWDALMKREVRGDGPPNGAAAPRAYLKDLSGIALAGGGIRSATFSLGVLQALAQSRLLRKFDFLSTVSGGGYIGGWWSAWLSRKRKPNNQLQGDEAIELFPGDEIVSPQRYPPVLLDRQTRPKNAEPDGSLSASTKDPIHHVRMFSNYLTPRRGILSADTWRAITVVTRNLLLTWVVLIAVALAGMLLTQLYLFTDKDVARNFIDDPFLRNRSSGPADPSGTANWPSVDVSLVTPACGGGCCRPSCHRRCGPPATMPPAALPVAQPSCDSTPGALRVHVGPDTVAKPTPLDSAARDSVNTVFRDRFRHIALPLIPLGVWLVTLVFLWLAWSGHPWLLALFGLIDVVLMAYLLAPMGDRGSASAFQVPRPLLVFTQLIVIGMVARWIVPRFRLKRLRQDKEADPESIQNRLTRGQTAFLQIGLVIVLFLVTAGFGADLVHAVLGRNGYLDSYVVKVGGITVFILSLLSGIYTAIKSAPSVRGTNATAEQSAVNRAIFAIAPVLVVAVLTVLLADASHRLLAGIVGPKADAASEIVKNIELAALCGVPVVLIFAFYESCVEAIGAPPSALFWRLTALPPYLRRDIVRVTPTVTSALIGVLVLLLFPVLQPALTKSAPDALMRACFATSSVLALICMRLASTKGPDRPIASIRLRWPRWFASPPSPAETSLERFGRLGGVVFVGALLVGAAVLGGEWLERLVMMCQGDDGIGGWRRTAWFFLWVAGVFVLTELVTGRGDRHRSTGLALVAALTPAAILMFSFVSPHGRCADGARALIAAPLDIALASVLVATVIGLGWLIDPNQIALHTFYKARLVRAYLGASNIDRTDDDITDSTPGDDVRLLDLANAERGAPIHLINTTLNLVGSRDLATAQRYAAPFLLSRAICGSLRTGYRLTNEYMSGGLTLGTAVAASGAAVSTNMGAKTQSAALSLLMAFFNVRLGIWVPTPDKSRWYERQARLWPIYLLTESLSQTNALGTYCYLTDGGHFENTGLYALVERACRNILVVDSGEDPKPNFADMGDAVRKCRIDFGAEIDLPGAVDQFLKAGDGGLTRIHYAIGTVRYSTAHLQTLGWPANEIEKGHEGTIVWLKPAVTKDESVDIRQYRIEKPPFPQQTTVNQWFTEEQFESYRALGFRSGFALANEMLRSGHPSNGAVFGPAFDPLSP